MRRVLGCLLFAFSCLPGHLLAQAFPVKPIRLVVLFAAGGPSDIVARMLGAKLAEVVNVPVVVENRLGANGIVGTEYVTKAPADGYTMMIASASSLAMNYATVSKLPYDTRRDLACISLVSTTPELLVVHPSHPAKTLKEFIAGVKARPGQSFGSTSAGSMPHLALELFKSAAGLDLVHVPYNGAAPATTAIMGGEQIIGLIVDMPVVQSHIASGKLRALAIASPARSPLFPALPTMAEQGLPGVEAVNWSGTFVPARTPADVLAKLQAGQFKALTDAGLKDKLVSNGADPIPGTSQQCTAFIEQELVRWGKIAKDAKISMDQ